MVEYTLSLDSMFGSLADPTRRDILHRVSRAELSVSEIARPYDLSLAAVSKHLGILERARLIIKRRVGRQQFVQAAPAAIKGAAEYLLTFEQLWTERFDVLESYLNNKEV